MKLADRGAFRSLLPKLLSAYKWMVFGTFETTDDISLLS
jgi:hypothetical protein